MLISSLCILLAPNLLARAISSRIFAPPSPSIVGNVFHKPQGLRTIYFILSLSLQEFFMIVCLVWFSPMTREGEIGKESSAPGDGRGPGTFFTACITPIRHAPLLEQPSTYATPSAGEGTSFPRLRSNPDNPLKSQSSKIGRAFMLRGEDVHQTPQQ
jgi:hypothetical protein